MRGIAELEALVAELREAGEVGLKRELAAGLRASAGPLKVAVRDAALRQLPKAGGLNQRVAARTVSVRTVLSARTVVVRLTTGGPGVKATDDGELRHPVFPREGTPRNEWAWTKKAQELPDAAGWWTRTLEQKSPLVSGSIDLAMARVEAKLMGGFGY